MKSLKKLSSNKKGLVIFVGLFAGVGVLLLVASRAATPFVSLETESASRSGSATTGNDSNASGGQYVQFGQPGGGDDDDEPFDPRTFNWQSVGPTGSLTFSSGARTISQNGAVLQNMEIHGRVTITGQNVTIRNSHIYSGEWYAVLVQGSGSVTIEDTEIGSEEHPGENCLAGPRVTARRVDIHHCEDGIKTGHNSSYEYMYVHDMEGFDSDPHADAIQDQGSGGWTLRKCWLDPRRSSDGDPGNASIIVKPDLGSINSALMEDCVFRGGNYTLYVVAAGGSCPTNVTVRRIYFTPDARYGPLSTSGCASQSNYTEWSGNYMQRWDANLNRWVNNSVLGSPW